MNYKCAKPKGVKVENHRVQSKNENEDRKVKEYGVLCTRTSVSRPFLFALDFAWLELEERTVCEATNFW